MGQPGSKMKELTDVFLDFGLEFENNENEIRIRGVVDQVVMSPDKFLEVEQYDKKIIYDEFSCCNRIIVNKGNLTHQIDIPKDIKIEYRRPYLIVKFK
jgi:hypothetical protein